MKLKEIKLKNFRNYKDINLEFNSGINIFIGDNGTGKTNILEAIYILSLTKSSRYGTDLDLIKQDENSLLIEGQVEYSDYSKKYKISIDKINKKVFINNNLIKKISNYVGQFSVTAFLPNDIEIIKGFPSARRNVLNIQIGVLYNNYLGYVNEYNTILRMRNEYLKRLNINGLSDTKYLDVINSKLIDISVKIYYYRFFYIKEINKILPNIYKKLSGKSDITILYQNNLGIEEYEEEKIKQILLTKYQKNLNKEMMQGMTLFGLHRDDLIFLVNNTDAKIYSSQGQQRLIVIAYKIAELLIYKKLKKEYPVLLLDDVFSEIDIKRRNNIVKFLKGEFQVVITTTDLEEIQNDLVKNAKIFKIKNGEIKIKGGAKCKKKK